jgi:hypothetical protein
MGGGGTTGSSSGTGGDPTGPVVPCGYPEPVIDCAPGEVCCFDYSPMNAKDFCSPPGQCTPPTKYAELQCDNNDDCPGKVCCAFVVVIDAQGTAKVQNTYCDDLCASDNEIQTCKVSGDCTPPNTCQVLFGNAYPTYQFCLPPPP